MELSTGGKNTQQVNERAPSQDEVVADHVGEAITDLTDVSIPRSPHVQEKLEEIYQVWDDQPYGYQWPASRLSRRELAKLTVVANTVKRPLNQLIKEAVSFYADKMLVELGYELPQVSESDPKC